MNRKQRRALDKKASDVTSLIEEKIALFGGLPDYCLTCETPFDKKDREMAMSWSVVVREQEGIVRLYCPACWKSARKIIEEINKGSVK